MRTVAALGLALVLGAWTSFASAIELAWKPDSAAGKPAPSAAPVITLGRPIPIASPSPTDDAASTAGLVPVSYAAADPSLGSPICTLESPRPLVRLQAPDAAIPSPPSPFPGGPPCGPAGEEAYNCGVVGPKRGFFAGCWDHCKEWAHGVPGSVTGIFQPGPGRGIFQSDHKYDDKFISPVSDPFH